MSDDRKSWPIFVGVV